MVNNHIYGYDGQDYTLYRGITMLTIAIPFWSQWSKNHPDHLDHRNLYIKTPKNTKKRWSTAINYEKSLTIVKKCIKNDVDHRNQLNINININI